MAEPLTRDDIEQAIRRGAARLAGGLADSAAEELETLLRERDHKIMPIEATDDMVDAWTVARNRVIDRSRGYAVNPAEEYRDMVAAAPDVFEEK